MSKKKQPTNKQLLQSLSKAARQARKARGWTQEDVAEYIGVTPVAYARIERGQVTPSIEIVARLADLFEIEADVLLGFKPIGALDQTSDPNSREWRKLVRRIRRADPRWIKLIKKILDEAERITHR